MSNIGLNHIIELAQKQDTPIIMRPNYRNAFFVRPLDNVSEKIDGKYSDVKLLQKTPKGGIIVGSEMMNPTVIAHELGHKMDESTVSKVAPSIDNVWSKYHLPLVGTLGAIAIGEIFPKYRGIANLANVGIQAGSMIPTLLSEYRASANANKIYPYTNKKQLNQMWNSHALGMVVNRLAIPLGVAGIQTGRTLLGY